MRTGSREPDLPVGPVPSSRTSSGSFLARVLLRNHWCGEYRPGASSCLRHGRQGRTTPAPAQGHKRRFQGSCRLPSVRDACFLMGAVRLMMNLPSPRQLKVTVEHVHVHSGGQAVVGVVAPTAALQSPEGRNAKQVAHAPQPPLRSEDPKREAVPVASDAERQMPDARRAVARGSKGE
jgi:hypothetical protein